MTGNNYIEIPEFLRGHRIDGVPFDITVVRARMLLTCFDILREVVQSNGLRPAFNTEFECHDPAYDLLCSVMNHPYYTKRDGTKINRPYLTIGSKIDGLFIWHDQCETIIIQENEIREFILENQQIHEPESWQKEDLIRWSARLAHTCLRGEACNRLKSGTGLFGARTNPIPVNGEIGEIKYLAKLRGLTGKAVFFHRLETLSSTASNRKIDEYEVVCLDGTQWGRLSFDIYHPRRSNHAPDGYTLAVFNRRLSIDLPLGYGVNSFVENFPYELPVQMEKLYDNGAIVHHARECLSNADFTRSS